MFVSHFNFGLMTITVEFANGDVRETNTSYGYKDAMDTIRMLHKAFGIEHATLVDAETGECIAEVWPE